MPIGTLSRRSTGLFAVACERCCAVSSTDPVMDDAYAITNNGRMPSSLSLGCSRCARPTAWRANPDEDPTDWRARRGRTAHRVRREGTMITVPYPYCYQGTPESERAFFICSTQYRFGARHFLLAAPNISNKRK